MLRVVAVSIMGSAAAFAFAAPPLTEQQRLDLETATDGSDHREQAFYALVESIRAWPPQLDPTTDGDPVHLSFDATALITRPQDFRGDLFRVEGELLQQSALAPPYEDVSEWFVRDARSGQPVMVYVVLANGTPAFAERQRVQADGRFYKSVRFTARDGQTRDYPAFVARAPESVRFVAAPASQPGGTSTANAGVDRLWIIGGLVAALLIAFAFIRVWAGRLRRAQTQQPSRLRTSWRDAEAGEVDDPSGLPDDPIEAMKELKRRASSN